MKMSCVVVFVFFKQKTAYEMRISDWSSDVCSSDLPALRVADGVGRPALTAERAWLRAAMPAEPPADHSGKSLELSLSLESVTLQIGRASCRERVCKYV